MLETLKFSIIEKQAANNRLHNPDLTEGSKNFDKAYAEFKNPNDMLIDKSELSNRIKNAVKLRVDYESRSEVRPKLFDKNYDELMLSDLAKLSPRKMHVIQNLGKFSRIEIENYLKKLGIK